MSADVNSASWQQSSLRWRGKVLTGKMAHWCYEWDELPIDETMPEWPCGCAEMDSAMKSEKPCPRCSVCEGQDHHWMPDCDDETGEPMMACKHCETTREIRDGDLED